METLRVLGQSNPGAATPTKLYTVPAATSTASSSIVICNQAATAGSFRVSIRVAGAVVDAKQYLYYDEPIDANDTFIATIGMTLAATDEVWVYASSANQSFNIFGVERA